MKRCSFSECKDYNGPRDTHLVVVDNFGYHWFCQHHWKFITFFFHMVRDCIRKMEGCLRNHKAEIYEDESCMSTVKFEGKYFDLCDSHLAIYDELLGTELMMPDWED